MKDFFKNRMDDFDEDDVAQFIERYLWRDDYRTGVDSSNSTSTQGRSNGRTSYHEDPEGKLMKFAKTYQMICDFFDLLGTDPRSYLEDNNRRGR